LCGRLILGYQKSLPAQVILTLGSVGQEPYAEVLGIVARTSHPHPDK